MEIWGIVAFWRKCISDQGQPFRVHSLIPILIHSFILLFVVEGVISQLPVCLNQYSIVVKKHHNPSKFYKRKHLIVAGLQFRGSVHYHHGRKHGSMLADMVLQK